MGFFLVFNVGPLTRFGYVVELGLCIVVAGGTVYFAVSVRSIVKYFGEFLYGLRGYKSIEILDYGWW